MAPSTTNPSTRRLSEVARHVVIPDGIVTTGWPAVEAKCREFGDGFDEWQRGAGRLILGKRDDGIYAATVGGVTLSIPRQVAKTFLVGRIIFALCVLYPGLQVIWTAHRTRTSTKTFKGMQGYAKRARVAPHIAEIRKANGEQEIVFTNGSIIMFGARESGFGRGFDEVDIAVFDEAQILTEKGLEDIVPATNQSRHPHGALLFFMGTPPRPVDPGEAFTARRTDALAHKPTDSPFGEPVIGEDQLYIECSADPDADPDDQAQWRIANPSFPHRTPLRSMLRLRKNLTSDESWCREGLGIWDSTPVHHLVDLERWAELEGLPDAQPTRIALAVAASRDRQWTYIGLAGEWGNGRVHLQVVRADRGTAWVIDELVRLKREHHPVDIAIAATDPAASLLPDMENTRGLRRVSVLQSRDEMRAAGLYVDLVKEGKASHAGGRLLGLSVEHARKKRLGESFLIVGPKDESIDVAPLKAVANALLGLRSSRKRPSERPERRAVVM